jgi:hypothetical protein
MKPPILSDILVFLKIIWSYSFFISEELMILNISESAQVAIMED